MQELFRPSPGLWRLGEPLPPGALRDIERTLQLRHFKWDTQVGDTRVLSPQALLMNRNIWADLCARAEEGARELFALEQVVAADAGLQRLIGVPRALRKLAVPGERPDPLRTLRFDFHPTASGWSLSEVNTDVPGGFGEASALTALFAPYQRDAVAPPSPLTAWGAAVAAEVSAGHAALLHAPGHLEDQQVVLTLGRELHRHGFVPHFVQTPAALRWRNGEASLRRGAQVPLGLVVRFYQAEWLARLPRRSGWRELFRRQERTRVLNPPEAVFSESKRLPRCFGAGGTGCTALRALFPECREPGAVRTEERAEWVLKAAYSNTGDEVHVGAELSPSIWQQRLRDAQRNPAGWIAQRRFETLALPFARGPVRPCVGVFVVGSRAAGAYTRLSATQVTDAHALEAPLFILPDPPSPCTAKNF